ncbi:MAG: Hsp33 family molecular chaperone HslO [Desulfopila sp.]|jgi:molecular chaperone Hsp33|nr:Hsp33 family molecular chaperone HslO [Desulfopila sp.]
MTDSLERIITQSGTIFGLACNTTGIVNEVRKRHDLGPTAAAALGRAITGAVLLAGLLKNDQNIQLIFEGNGPLGKVVAQASSSGWSRGYVAEPRAELPLKNGRIDVAGGIGKAGFLRVIKDIGFKEKYTGLVQLYTSEIGEDIAYYLTESEQTPSTINLSIHLEPDGTVAAAGGYLIQALPPVSDEVLQELEENTRNHESVSALLTSGFSPLKILSHLFQGVPHKHTGSTALSFSCFCSKEKMENILHTLSQDDINYLLEQNEGVEVKCDWCNENYCFSRDYLLSLAAQKKHTG